MGRVPSVVVLLAVIALPVAMRGQTGTCAAAMQKFRERRWSEAAAGFTECERMAPGTTDALLYRGKALVNLQKYDDAAAALKNYAKLHPQSDDPVYLLAYIAFREDKPKDSLQLFSDAAKLKPPGANDLMIAALDYVLLNDYAGAAHYLESSLKMNPDDIEARYHLGRVRYQQNQFDLAIAAFQEVIKRDPGNVKAHDNLGLSLQARNQIEPAIAEYRKAIELDQAAALHSEQPYLNLGALLARSNRVEEAIPLLERALQIAPREFEVHYELGKAYFDSHRFDLARQQAEEAVKVKPSDSSGHYLLGRIYQRLNRKELASEQFRLTSELIRDKNSNSESGMSTGVDSR
jgi:tetratricopeptide (TPR) repeat protein